MKSLVEHAVNESLRKTINRFRERPLYYFTEADIHSSLQNDLLKGNSALFHNDVRYKISLVHLEYPTNFRYVKNKLLEGYNPGNNNHEFDKTTISGEYGDRGNFDLAIINGDFCKRAAKYLREDLKGQENYVLHIINKDVKKAIQRFNNKEYNQSLPDSAATSFQKEVEYAIEVKYLHPFNARNKSVLYEIIKDNKKLHLAYIHSNEFIKPINLIFCSSSARIRRGSKDESVITDIKDYIKKGKTHVKSIGYSKIDEGILNIFIESFYKDAEKNTEKPIAFCHNPGAWAQDLCKSLKIYLTTEYS